MKNFLFYYDGIIPLNYKGKGGLNNDIDEILKNTINTTIDLKKKESSIKKLCQICLMRKSLYSTNMPKINKRL